MYNFSIGGGSKDPYNFSIGGGGDSKSKGFGLTGNLSKAGGGLTGGVSSSFMSSSSQAKKPSSTYSSGFGGGFGDLKSITQASQSSQSSKITTSASSTSAANNKKGSTSSAISSQPSGQSVAAKNNTKKKGAKSKFGEDIIPRRFGLRYDPPTIIMEYMVPTNGKLYHHKMKMMKLQKDTAVNDGLEYLRKKHSTYLVNDNVSDDQLISLIERLQKRLPTEKKNTLGATKATAKTTVDSKNAKASASTATAASKKSDSMTTSTPLGKTLAPGKIEPLKKSNSLAPLGKNNDFSEPKASTMIRGATTNSTFGGSSTIRSSSVGISSKLVNKQESSDEELDQDEEQEDVFKYAWSKKGAGSIQANKPVPLSSVKNEFNKENGIYGKNKSNLAKGYGQESDEDDDDDEDEDQYNYDQEDEEEDEDDDGVDYHTYNLNKLSNDELKRHKDKMENLFRQNSLKPGDKDYQYNVEEEFNPEESNEWDEDEE